MNPIVMAIIVLAGLGAILGIAIGICSKFLQVEEDNRVEDVLAMLPGANCGSCGFPGCTGMADAIVNNNADPRLCKPCKAEKIEAIKKYLELAKADIADK